MATHLGSFEGRSKFRTWVYRVAVRTLLNMKRGRAEQPLSFEDFAQDLGSGFDHSGASDIPRAERELLKKEVRIACTQAMLLCLDRDHRMAYLLGELLEMSGDEAAQCQGVSPATHRKRLSRARQRVEGFTSSHCGLVSECAPCRCVGRIRPALASRRIDPGGLLFARHPVSDVSEEETAEVVGALEEICDAPSLLRSNPRYTAPGSVLEPLSRLAASSRH